MPGFRLGPEAQAAGFRLDAYDTVGSTNSEAAAAARAGSDGDRWFVALQQTEGRGRRGRPWASPHGNLAASLLLVPDAEPKHMATLGFVAGIALDMAIERVLPGLASRSGIDGADGCAAGERARIALKWPNDVLADGAKLAGILLEAQPHKTGRQAIVIGIGVNVVAAPEGLPYPATSLDALGAPVSALEVFSALSDAWVTAFRLWNGGKGIAEVLALWRQSAVGVGAEVAVQTPDRTLRGIFETIDDSGRLVIRMPDGDRLPISAGDVHFGTMATVAGHAREQQ